MSRKKHIELIKELEIPTIIEIDFETALKEYKKVYSFKAPLMDKAIVRIFIQKRIPSLMASQDEFNKLFKQF